MMPVPTSTKSVVDGPKKQPKVIFKVESPFKNIKWYIILYGDVVFRLLIIQHQRSIIQGASDGPAEAVMSSASVTWRASSREFISEKGIQKA